LDIVSISEDFLEQRDVKLNSELAHLFPQ